MEYLKEVLAQYDRQCIRVYQAYYPTIAAEAVRLQTFGEHFSKNRMTWVKPSFLWMMYRSNWGTKKNQECILAIDLYRECFDRFLAMAVLTSPDSRVWRQKAEWEKTFESADVYCQWDPDKNVNGNPMNQAAIQIGLRRNALNEFLTRGICRIEDFTPTVVKWREQRKKGTFQGKYLPVEKIYPVENQETRKRLGMKSG